jgi:hypothetical protein
MKITQDNYEQFFLDHAEGTLPPEMERELSDFIQANPDLKTVLEDFDPSPLQTEEMRDEMPKAGLKKHLHLTDHIREDNVDEWMIRDLEGQLDEAEESELSEFISLNPAYSFDHKIFGYTKLSPDLSITYRQKKELKKEAARFPIWRMAWLIPAAAAVILLFIGIRFFMKPEIQPAHPIATVIAEVPVLASPVITAGKTTLPALKNGTPSREHPDEIVRSNAGRMKPISAEGLVLLNPSETKSLYLADFYFAPVQTVEKKHHSLIAKVFDNMVAQARESFDKNTNLDKARKTDINIWSIAKAGINGYNSISDRDLELYIHKDEDGKVKSYALVDQERLILEKELDKN